MVEAHRAARSAWLAPTDSRIWADLLSLRKKGEYPVMLLLEGRLSLRGFIFLRRDGRGLLMAMMAHTRM